MKIALRRWPVPIWHAAILESHYRSGYSKFGGCMCPPIYVCSIVGGVVKKHVVLIAIVALFFCLFVPPSGSAQTGNTCLAVTTWWFPDPIPQGWFYYGPYPGTFAYLIASWTASCVPPAASQETCPTCPHAGQPISLVTGNTYIDQTDIRVPGLGGGLQLMRRWNSVWPSTQTAVKIGIFGPNWRCNYEESLFMGSDGYFKYSRGDGSFWSFASGSNGSGSNVAAPQNVVASLASGTTNWTITFQNGEQRLFNNTTGLLVSIIDPNGNATQLSYDGLLRLATITDPVGRHLFFNYSGSSRLVSSVTSDISLTLSYAYDTQNRLSQVTKPDLTHITFQYDANSYISTVLDNDGKVLESHTYDGAGRGLSSSRANGVESLTVTYPTQ